MSTNSAAGGLSGSPADRTVGIAEVRVHRVGAVVDRRLQRRGGVGGVVEVVREGATLDVGVGVGRINRVHAEVERHVGLLLEAEVAATDEDHRVATFLLELETGRVAGRVADLATVVEALCQPWVGREAGTAVAVPEDPW